MMVVIENADMMMNVLESTDAGLGEIEHDWNYSSVNRFRRDYQFDDVNDITTAVNIIITAVREFVKNNELPIGVLETVALYIEDIELQLKEIVNEE